MTDTAQAARAKRTYRSRPPKAEAVPPADAPYTPPDESHLPASEFGERPMVLKEGGKP
jgi:hypothetical protein